MPDGALGTSIMTIGFDPERKGFVGTWIGSMMNFLWLYEGELDAAGRVLTLNAEGPDMSTDNPGGKTARYRDIIELKSDDHRVLTSHMLRPDGTWQQFMTANYRWRK